jgi:RNA polymerase sigma factor (sigma-70 family)
LKHVGSVAAETTSAVAEAQLYERHSDLVYRYCLRMLSSREEAEDATQTTFFQAVRALRRGVVPNFEQAWLLTIARNECKSRYRASARRRACELAHDPQTLAEFAEAAPNGSDGRLIGVQGALSRLPETQRRALLLREWQGRSYAEIARELGVSRPAVEALIFRARRGLARELGEETKERRHAFDIASLLGALKTLLGGGAAVKVAAGVAAVATVGVVAGDSGRGPAPLLPVQGVAPENSPAVAKTPSGVEAAVVAPRRTGSNQRVTPRSTSGRRTGAVTRNAKPVSAAPIGAPPETAPGVEQSAPQPAPAQAPQPGSPVPAGTPSLPEVPAVPTPPQPPPALELPPIQLPVEVPQLPPLPQVQVPELPVVSEVLPEVPVPEVPDLPIVGDVPILP